MADMTASERQSLPVHVDMCEQRYRGLAARLQRVEYILYAIVALLLFGEGTVVDVVRRLLTVAPA